MLKDRILDEWDTLDSVTSAFGDIILYIVEIFLGVIFTFVIGTSESILTSDLMPYLITGIIVFGAYLGTKGKSSGVG